jgi:TPR repeat protein
MHLLGKMGPKPARPLAGAISNDEQAHKYLHEAATKGQVQAQVMLGGRMESSGDIAGAQRWYLMAAEGGDPHLSASERGASSAEAQCRLGGLYSAGKAGDRAGDYSHGSEAQRWYLKAATNPDGPNAEAMFQLGLAYEGGYGKAASGDDGTRTGASIDYAKAMAWHKKAAEQGHEGGRKAVGMMYRHGKGVPKDFDTAQMWWKGTM